VNAMTENITRYIKNIDFSSVQTLADLVSYQPGQVVSKTLAQNRSVSLTLFAFDKGEEISAHESSGDAMIVALDGVSQITIGAEKYAVGKGETIVMPSRVPHAVLAAERFKMLLIVVFPQPETA
jgi:quercetin dioxygenase-like cupin family protein